MIVLVIPVMSEPCGSWGLRPQTLAHQKKTYYRSAATKIIVLSFEELMVFVISNQSRSCGFWGLRPQTPAYQNKSHIIVVLLLKLLFFLLKN